MFLQKHIKYWVMADTQKKVKVVLVKYAPQVIERDSNSRYLKSLGVRVHSINCRFEGKGLYNTITVEIWEQIFFKNLTESQKISFYKNASKVFVLYPKYCHSVGIGKKNRKDMSDYVFYVGAENIIIIPDTSMGKCKSSKCQGSEDISYRRKEEGLLEQIAKDTAIWYCESHEVYHGTVL
uniref:Uncharacterized protein n=1 Tax=Marseillevirus LCMAC101 TaxID=2506602 RepID=A0A481YRQ7_9VIRU|nr:MAG: hypothetical protein LCMAC101_02020 [Marseillevirus LCMAC101]